MEAMNIGLSGATAAGQRAAVAANNIANVLSTAVTAVGGTQATSNQQNASGQQGADGSAGFQPLRAEQTSVVNGGVRVITRPVDPPSIPVFDPTHPDANPQGVVALPNVSLEREFIELIFAQRAYEASIATIHTADQMLGTVLDRRF